MVDPWSLSALSNTFADHICSDGDSEENANDFDDAYERLARLAASISANGQVHHMTPEQAFAAGVVHDFCRLKDDID